MHIGKANKKGRSQILYVKILKDFKTVRTVSKAAGYKTNTQKRKSGIF